MQTFRMEMYNLPVDEGRKMFTFTLSSVAYKYFIQDAINLKIPELLSSPILKGIRNSNTNRHN